MPDAPKRPQQTPQNRQTGSAKRTPPFGARQTQGGKATKPDAVRRKPAAAATTKTAAGQQRSKSQDDRPVIYGAEALAALTVAESKLSRIKGRMILALTVLLTCMVIWNAVLSGTRPEPKLLAMTTDGRVQPLPLLDQPIENRQVLMDWVRRNIPSMYDFNYANFQSQIGKARNFTQQVTLETFMDDLETSGILSKVRNEFLLLRANITNTPIVTGEDVVRGRRLWVVEIPMTLVYDSGDVQNGARRQIQQPILFTAWIVRANVLEFDGGLMLAKYAVTQRRG